MFPSNVEPPLYFDPDIDLDLLVFWSNFRSNFRFLGIGLNQRSAPFMQLPHFREEFIKHLNAKKTRSLRQLATKPPQEIRDIFRNVSFTRHIAT